MPDPCQMWKLTKGWEVGYSIYMPAKKNVKKTPSKKDIEKAKASVEEAIAKLEVEEVEVETTETEEVIEKPTEDASTASENSEKEEIVEEPSAQEKEEESMNEKSDETLEESSESVKTDESTSDSEASSNADVSASGTAFSKTSFEEEKSGGGGKSKLIITICLIIIFTIFGFIGGYFYGKGSLSSSVPEFSEEPTPTVEATPTPEEVDLSAYSIEILNGSGVAGVAGDEQEALEADGFKVENTGNAENQDFTETVIAAKSDVSKEYLDKLKDSLAARYTVDSSVEELDADDTYDVVITVGSETVVDE